MAVSVCPDVVRYQQMASGQLPLEEQESLLLHLEGCDACARQVEALPSQDTLVELLRQTRTHADDVSAEQITLLVNRLSKQRPAALEATTTDCKSPGEHDPSLTDFLMPSQADDELGRLGKYRILKILGCGGMGVVYLAEDPLLKRAVALKAMLPGLAGSANAGKRFRREAQAMAAVENDHVVRVLEVAEERGVSFLAMEYLRGEPLDVRLGREGKLPVLEAIRIGREVAEGLHAAHERGLIHRDIKPGNIWLEAPRGRVKILDFGLARSTQQEAGVSQQGTIIGTPAYMAPEQARGDKVDARCDLFSLGVVLYRLGCGQPAFRGADTVSALMAVATEQPPALQLANPELPNELSALVMQLLEKDPARRPASAAAVAEALQALEQQLGRPPQSVSAPARRRLVPVLIGVLLLAGLVGLWASGVLRFPTAQGELVLESDDPDFAFAPVKGGGVMLEDRKNKKSYALNVVPLGQDRFQLEVQDKGGDLVFHTETFTVKRGDKVALKAWFERKEAAVVKPPGVQAIEEAWFKQVAALPAEQQVEAVVAKLKERNPGFDDTGAPKYVNGVVTELRLTAKLLTDLSPVRVLVGLEALSCSGSGSNAGRFPTLRDLSPLNGMKLKRLQLNHTYVEDLSPLAGMPLMELNLMATRVSDLSPLKGMPLTKLSLYNAPVSDLLPLKDLPLMDLNLTGTKVTDLSPLKDVPLRIILGRFKPERDAEALRSIKSLEKINNRPVAVFWKEWDEEAR